MTVQWTREEQGGGRGGGAGPFVGSGRLNECGAEQQNSRAMQCRNPGRSSRVGKQARNRNEATADKEWNLYLGAIGFRCPTKTTWQGQQGQGRQAREEKRSGMPCPAWVLGLPGA